MPLFIIVLRYIQPLDIVDLQTVAHRAWLDDCIANGLLLASGRQEPQTGGVLIAQAKARSDVQTLIQQDPFYQHDLAEYQIFEFTPTRFSKAFKTMLDDSL